MPTECNSQMRHTVAKKDTISDYVWHPYCRATVERYPTAASCETSRDRFVLGIFEATLGEDPTQPTQRGARTKLQPLFERATYLVATPRKLRQRNIISHMRATPFGRLAKRRGNRFYTSIQTPCCDTAHKTLNAMVYIFHTSYLLLILTLFSILVVLSWSNYRTQGGEDHLLLQ